MSGVLHPVGPEPDKTYWIRRAVVVGAVLVAALLIAVIAVNAGGSEREAAPAPAVTPATSTPTADLGGPTATPTPTDAPTWLSSSTSADRLTSKKADPSPKTTASPSPSKKVTPDCDPKELRTTLTGKQRVKVKQSLTFNLSLINGGPDSCIVRVNPDLFELKIYSGTDRIWSTADCPRQVKEIAQVVGPEKAVEWHLTWNGRRSAKTCRTRPEIPRAGTYFATAQLDGAKPVQLGMTLR
ncbi:hypothetical protein GCM10009841_27080 [Microlunatus panaciterrae]|uniref:Intracellular proteinase inhibitor n=1 Tax=Microlunatus panaciterrae TaxID=400768 RepID=A0ABS2RKD8_9ACTN|nr:hypothetical protein [Microlunatus panaciterrae]MBM7798409.1 hypothetical protein [Microlunatus panaciterrae]